MVILENMDINMDMPERCEECRFYNSYYDGCYPTHWLVMLRGWAHEKPACCPLKEVENGETGH